MFQSLWTRTVIVIALTLAATSASLSGQAQSPWFGAWSLNAAKSAGNPSPARYKRVTFTIEPLGDGLQVFYDMVGTRGGTTHMEWSGKFDGKDYPVRGVDYVLTNAYSRIADSVYGIVVKVDGALVATSRVTVAPDGRTLTTVTSEKNARGNNVETTVVYDKR